MGQEHREPTVIVGD
jgi:hypothetical protein